MIATTSGGSPAIRVVYGIVNSIVPGGMNLSDDPPFILTGISGSGYVYLKTTTHATTGDLVSVAINKASSMPPEEATHHHLAIGTFVSSGGSVTVAQGISGSQAFELCGGPTGGTATWGLV